MGTLGAIGQSGRIEAVASGDVPCGRVPLERSPDSARLLPREAELLMGLFVFVSLSGLYVIAYRLVTLPGCFRRSERLAWEAKKRAWVTPIKPIGEKALTRSAYR